MLPESGRNRMWKAMQVLGQFSVRELMHAASLDHALVAFGEAKPIVSGWPVAATCSRLGLGATASRGPVTPAPLGTADPAGKGAL